MTKLFPLAVMLLCAGCSAHRDNRSRGSITVDLPPARAATPAPGFSLQAQDKAAQPADERESQAVQELAASSR